MVPLKLGRADWWMISLSAFICLCVGIAAFVSSPNGSDQLQYHLPRMVEWADRQSIAFFPTHYYVQLFAPPLAEWMMLQSFILSGGDHFVNLVQWLSFCGSAVCGSLIAKELGSGRRGQIVAAVFCVTLPQGILGASGAKNDWVLSFWMAAMVYFLLRARSDQRPLTFCNIGIATGAAILSKGTAYPFLPFIGLACLVPLMVANWRLVLRRAPLVIGIILLMNVPQWSRNYSLGGSPFGLSSPDVAGHDKYTIDHLSVAGTIANVLREGAMHFGLPGDSLDRRATKAVRSIIESIGIDPDDPGAINYSKFGILRYNREEYDAGNPLHMALVIVTFGVLFIGWRSAGSISLLLAFGIVASFVFYCALFRWEQWCPRLHLPLFIIAAGVVATVLSRRFPRIVVSLMFILLVTAFLPALCNDSRPLLLAGNLRHPSTEDRSIFLRSREQLYFTEEKDLAATYIPAAAAVREQNCGDVGIDTSLKPYSHEYALFALARLSGRRSQFRYVGVENISRKFMGPADLRQPCVVICSACRTHPEKMAEYASVLPREQIFGDLVIFSAQGVTQASGSNLSGRSK
jgi:hypothetical protein